MAHAPLYVIRHGQTDWNAEGRLQGQTDRDLDAKGERQAKTNGEFLAAQIGDRLAEHDFVASPMLRARRTMQIIRGVLGLPEGDFRTDERLKELSFGDWESFTFEELERRDPGVTDRREADKWNFVPPGDGAESYALLAERVAPWLDETLAADRPTVSVSHGGIVRSIMSICGFEEDEVAARSPIPQDRVGIVEDRVFRWL